MAVTRSPLPSPLSLGRGPADRLSLTGIVVGAFLALFMCQFDLCMRLQGHIPFPPIYPLIGLLAALTVIIWYFSPDKVAKVLHECRGVLGAFAATAVLAFTGAALPEADLGEGGMNMIYPTLDFMLFLLALPVSALFVSTSQWRVANGLALCGIVVSILIDARNPGTFSSMETRAAGFGVNPNRGAAITAMLLAGVLDWKKPRMSLGTCFWVIVAFTGVFMTLSRSGILLLGVVCTSYLRLSVRRNGIATLIILGGLAFSVGGYALVAADAAKSVLPMFEGTNSRANLFNGQLDAMDTTDDSRVILIYEYLEMIAQHPLIGSGTGFTYGNELGAHNMYLARWVDNGFIGLLAYVLLIWGIFQIGRRHQSWECMTTALFIAVYGFFTHNLLEQKNALLIMAIVAGRAVLNTQNSTPLVNAVLRSEKIPYPRREPLAKAG